MKKQFVSFIFLLFFILTIKLTANNERIIKKNEVELRKEVLYVVGEKEPFSGIVNEYYENGSIKTQYSFKNGLQNGISKTFYENGNLKAEYPFVNDTIVGIVKEYYENGNISIIGSFSDNMPEGPSKSYYETGEIENESVFVKGKREGELKEYHKNGNLKTIVFFVNDLVNGIAKSFYETGELKTIANYTDDLLDGEYKEYYKDGSLESESFYKNGVLNGALIEYFPNGVIKEKIIFKDGIEQKSIFKLIAENFIFVIIIIAVISGLFSFYRIKKIFPKLDNLDNWQKDKIFKKLTEYNSEDISLHSAYSLNGIGSSFFKSTSMRYNNEEISILAKAFSFLFMPTPFILGYLVCFDKDKIIATLSKKDLKNIIDEIKKEIL